MSWQGSAPPADLASLLATLAQFAPPGQAQTPASTLYRTSQLRPEAALNVVEDPRLSTSSSRTPVPDKNVIDPAAITEWSSGLRCVSKIAAQNQTFAASIREVQENVKAENTLADHTLR